MAEEVTIVIKGDNKASKPIDDASKSVKGLGDESTKSAQSVGGMNTSLQGAQGAAGGLSPAMMAAGVAVAGVAAAAVAAAAAVGALISVAQAGIEAFREQDAVNRSLEQSLRGAGFAGGPLREAIADIDASIGDLAKSTMFSDEELKKMASTFIRVSGQSTATKDQLKLIADMATGMGKSTEEATRIMAQAMKGDLPKSLSDTTSLTREQIAALRDIEDPADRARAATDLLAQTFGGASENINGYFGALKNLEDAKGDFLQKIGEVITESGAFEPVINAITDALNSMEGWIGENKEALQSWIIDAVAKAVDYVTSFIEVLQFLSPVLATMSVSVQNTVKAFDSLKLAAQVVIDLFISLQTQVIGRMTQAISKLLDGLSAVAGFVSDDLSASIKRAADATRGFSEVTLGVSKAAFEGAIDKTQQIGENIVESIKNIADLPARSERFGNALGTAANATRNIARNIRDAKDNLGKVREEADKMPDVAVAEGEAETKAEGVKSPAAQAAKDTADEEERRNRIASMRLALLTEEDAIQRAVLEYAIKDEELRGRKLTDMEREFEATRIQMELNQSIADEDDRLHQQKMDAIHAEAEARRVAAEELRQQRQEEVEYHAMTLQGLNASVSGLGDLTSALYTLRNVQEGTREATEATIAAYGGLATLGGQLAGLITEDRKKAAKIEALFHGAAAIGAFASWAASGFLAANYGVAAAQHTVAAAKYAVVAGSGSSDATPGRGAAGGGGSGAMVRDRARAQTAGDAKQPDVVINVDMGSSTNLRSAVDTGREIGRTVADAARNEFRL
jgi:hypothetical protein